MLLMGDSVFKSIFGFELFDVKSLRNMTDEEAREYNFKKLRSGMVVEEKKIEDVTDE